MTNLKQIARSMAIAFSMYSKIPMPQFEWKEEDMRYSMCFFPFVGIVIGLLSWGWWLLCRHFGIGKMCFSFIGLAIILLVTGGIHMDGYMDTMDALHSYGSREKKLEILKDSHIGAFAVIMTVLYVLIAAGAYSEISKANVMASFCGAYFLSRIFSAIAVVSFPCAKKEGTLYLFADSAHERIVKTSLYVELVICVCWQIWMSPKAGLMQIVCAAAVFGYYYYKSKKEFGGITGDLAGYFVTLCEGALMVMAAIACL